jgi:hypothetical protein
MSLLKKPKYGNINNNTGKNKAWNIAFDMIGLHNPWINVEQYTELSEPITMSDEEVYYVASIVSELKTLTQQRALIDMMHLKCDEYTIKSFMSYFSNSSLNKIMLSC